VSAVGSRAVVLHNGYEPAVFHAWAERARTLAALYGWVLVPAASA